MFLTPVYEEDIPSLYSNNLHRVKFHHYNDTSHVSKSTAKILQKLINETESDTIRFNCIPLKSTNVPSMDYCAFTFYTTYNIFMNGITKYWVKTRDVVVN